MQVSAPAAVITWEAAHRALAGAVNCAQELGVRINAAVVDSGGNLAGFLRMPGASLHSIGIAQDKAFTAAAFGLPTGKWDEVLPKEANMLRDGLQQRPRMVMFGGGLPIAVDGELCGGIGVSGASEDEDEACARAGLAALGL